MATPLRVLILEDRPTDAELVVHELRRSGFDPDWQRVDCEADFVARLDPAPDIILADYSLPQWDAPRALRAVQERGLDVPVIMISGTVGEDVAVECIKQGAVDYLLKERLGRLGPAVIKALEDKRLRVEKQQAEAALRESEERHRLLFDNASLGIGYYTPQGQVVAFNKVAAGHMGGNPENYTGRTLTDLYGAETAAVYLERIQVAVESQDSQVYEDFVPLPNGDKWFLSTYSRITDASGTVVGVQIISQDITKRRRAEDALAAERQLLRTLIDSLPDRVYAKDAEGRFILKNLVDVHLMGVASADDVVGKTDFDYYPLELAELYHADDMGVMQSGQSLINREEPIVDAEGNQGWILTSKVPLRDNQGTVVGLIGIGRDITERKQADEARARYADRLGILHAIDRAILSARSTEEIAGVAVAHIQQIVNPYRLMVLAFDPDTGVARTLATVGSGVTQLRAGTILALENILGLDQLRERHMVVVEDLAAYTDLPVAKRAWLAEGVRSITNIPFFFQDRLVGLIGLGHDQPGPVNAEHVEIIREIGDQIAVAITQAHLHEAEHRQRMLAEALRDTAAALISALDFDAVMSMILGNVARVVPHDAANIMLLQEETALVVAWRGYPNRAPGESFLYEHRYSLDTPHLREMFETGLPVFIADTALFPDWEVRPESTWIRSHIAAPILSHGKVIGFLNVDSAVPGFFSEDHARRLQSFADQASVAIERAQLYEEIRRHATELEQRVEERTAQLNHAKERIEAILNSSNDVMILCRTDGTIDQINPAFDETFGHTPGEIYNQPLATIVIPEHAHLLDQTFETVVQIRKPTRLEVIARYKKSPSFDADMMLSPVVGQDNQLFGVICSLRDITPRKQMEVQLRRMLEHEMELGELKSRYMSMAAHDLRNPLAVIQIAVDMIRQYSDRLTDEQKRTKFDHIHTNVNVMVEMLDDILTLGKAESGKLRFDPAPLDVVTFCQSLSTEITQATQAAERIIISTDADCGSVRVDAQLLRHILSNMLSNALKYSPEDRPVTFTINCQPDQIAFRVQDHGIGIPEDEQERLFETFHRASNAQQIPGTGLGLAIVKQSVELHGGTITFESEEGRGTTFTVTLPRIPGTAISD